MPNISAGIIHVLDKRLDVDDSMATCSAGTWKVLLQSTECATLSWILRKAHHPKPASVSYKQQNPQRGHCCFLPADLLVSLTRHKHIDKLTVKLFFLSHISIPGLRNVSGLPVPTEQTLLAIKLYKSLEVIISMLYNRTAWLNNEGEECHPKSNKMLPTQPPPLLSLNLCHGKSVSNTGKPTSSYLPCSEEEPCICRVLPQTETSRTSNILRLMV